jgi:hypothetical protein
MSKGRVVVKINIHVDEISADLKAELEELVKYVQDNPNQGLYLEAFHSPSFEHIRDISMTIEDE